ncbi:MAG: extracellular solute-binding protein [Pseudomonadota bacterium]
MTYRGLTWDHPRGRDPLVAAAGRVNKGHKEPLIEWHTQPLEGFESAPIDALAQHYDLLIIDHPHVGKAVAKRCLMALDTCFSHDQLALWEKQSVGPSFASYNWPDASGTPTQWALPLDVATQVMARRPDRLAEPPASWDDLVAAAQQYAVAQSLAGPHAFLTLLSMVAAFGAVPGGEGLFADAPALLALETMQQLYALRPAGSEALNPIAMCEAMADGSIDCVGLIFGYVNYADAHLSNAIAFSNSIGVGEADTGGVLGGTGLAISARCTPNKDLLDHLAWLMKADVHTTMIPRHGGQPSARVAWEDEGLNSRWNRFYANCLTTAERACVRPRFDGYIAFQTIAAERIRQALRAREDPERTLDTLRGLWRDARSHAVGPLHPARAA